MCFNFVFVFLCFNLQFIFLMNSNSSLLEIAGMVEQEFREAEEPLRENFTAASQWETRACLNKRSENAFKTRNRQWKLEQCWRFKANWHQYMIPARNLQSFCCCLVQKVLTSYQHRKSAINWHSNVQFMSKYNYSTQGHSWLTKG